MATRTRSCTVWIWISLLLGSTCCCVPMWWAVYGGHSEPEKLMASVPLGSSVRDLRVAVRKGDHAGRVFQWIPSPEGVPESESIRIRMDGVTIRTEYGVFRQKLLGDYDHWYPTQELETQFTGEIYFLVEVGLLQDMTGVSFTYIDGRLMSKE
jgi:hypothetical protein